MSAEPVGGISIKAITASTDPNIKDCGAGRQPRRTAASPAARPVPPIRTAIQVIIDARTSEICASTNHGGNGGAAGNAVTAAEGPRTPIATISATLTPIAG